MARPEISPILQTVFADLCQQVATAPPAGSVYRRAKGEIEYLYAKVPVGAGRIDRFLGRAGEPEAESAASDLERGMRLAAERRRLVSGLRRQGFAGPDRTGGAILDALAQAGLFSHGAVLVGTAAYQVSGGLLGRHLPAPTLMTGDVDIATASLALTAEPPEPLAAILGRADPSFQAVMPLDPGRPAARFRNDQGYLVDLITPLRRRDQPSPVRLAALRAGAVPLQQIAWLIADPAATVALWGAGVPVSIPQPARFAVHKLILAQKRDPSLRLKRNKDLAQARAIIEALLETDRFALLDALGEARALGRRGWAIPIERSLTELKLAEAVGI